MAAWPGCRAVNVTKGTLEGLFADELALLQPTPGYMRLLKESVLQIWKARKAAMRDEIATAERAAKAIQEKLDRLDEHSSSTARSTSRRTTVTPRSFARNSRSRGSTVTQASSKNSTLNASWPLQNAFCSAPPTCGPKPHWTSGSGSNNCSFQRESCSTEIASLEPAQPHRLSATCGKSEPEMKEVVDLTGIEPVTS